MTPLFRRSSSTDAAFERLYRRHVTDVYRYAYAVLGEQADAEDVTQTTFLNAYRAYSRGERAEKPENWLIAIAHNVCRQRFRQAKRRPEVALGEHEPAAPEREGPTAEDLRRAFSQLPPNQREALVMRELEGRSYAEIAAVMGVSQSALETLIFRARRTLREQLEEQLTCDEAAFALSQQADGRLSAAGKRSLRAHLRACPECARAAQRDRAIRGALKGILAVPLPTSLASFFGGAAGTSVAGPAATGLGVKAIAVLAAGAVAAGGGGYEAAKQHRAAPHRAAAAPTAAAKPVVAPLKLPAPVHVRRALPPAAKPHGKAKGHAKPKHVPPGQAKQHAQPKRVPPGRAKQAERGHVPPGQAKKAHPKPKHVPRGKAKGHAKHGKP
jgi:RNA polymerase sigma factor (sigma-70 family)